NANVHPAASETCNGVDEDCDGNTDEGVLVTSYADADGDGFGNAASSDVSCEPPAGNASAAGDCDDANAAAHPGAIEVCDGFDDDCDGAVDDADVDRLGAPTFYTDTDDDGFGVNPVMACVK